MKSVMYSELRYKHPGEIEGEPQEVARLSAADLEEASAIFARHVVATARQVRSGYLSEQLAKDPSLTPDQLNAAWESSVTELACVKLVRASKAANAAVRSIRELQE